MYSDNRRTLNLGSGNFIPGGNYDNPETIRNIQQGQDNNASQYTADASNWKEAVERSQQFINNTPDNTYNASVNYDNSTQNAVSGTDSTRPTGGSNNKVKYSTNISFGSKPIPPYAGMQTEDQGVFKGNYIPNGGPGGNTNVKDDHPTNSPGGTTQNPGSPAYHTPNPSDAQLNYEGDPWDRIPYTDTWNPYRQDQVMKDNNENTVTYDTSVSYPGSTNFQKDDDTTMVGQDFGWQFGGANDQQNTAQGIGGWNISTDNKANITNDVKVDIGEGNEFGVGATVGNNYAISFVNQGKDNPFTNMEKAVQYSALNDNFLARSRGKLSGMSRGAAATNTAEAQTDIRGKVERLYNSVGEAQKYYQAAAKTKRYDIFGAPSGTPTWKAPKPPKDMSEDDD